MSLPMLIEQYLDRHHITAKQSEHPAVYTAHQLAEVEHKLEAQVSKVVFFFTDSQLAMGVLPANRNLNLHLIRHATRAQHVRLATEREIAERVKDVEVGAIPPFGSLFGIPVYMDEACMGTGQFEVPGGTLTRSLTMNLEDYLREERPMVAPLSRKPIHRSSSHRPPEKYEFY